MKKLLVFLLILAVAGGLFAQDISWSGSVDTGLRVYHEIGDKDVTPDFNRGHIQDWEDDAAGPQTNLTFAVDFGSYGLKGAFTADVAGGWDYTAFVWAKFVDEVINLYVGKGFDGFSVVYDWNGGSDGVGYQLKIVPIEGLTFGLWFPGVYGTGDADTGGIWPIYFFQETAIGVYYTSDLFKASAIFKLDSDHDVGTNGVTFFGDNTLSALPPTKANKETFLQAGVEITAIDNLTIDVAAKVDNLSDWASDGSAIATIVEKVAYKVSDAFDFYVLFTEILGPQEIGDAKAPTGLNFEAGLGYVISDPYKVTFAAGATDWLFDSAWDDLADGASGFHNESIWLKPGFVWTLGDHATIDSYYKFTINNKWTSNDPDRNNVGILGINFNWSF